MKSNETNLEYDKLVRLLNSSDTSAVYEELIQKEQRVLDTVNRVVNYSNEKQVVASEFMNMSLDSIIHALFWNLRLVFRDVIGAKNAQDIWRTLTKDDRPIYFGILLVLLALFLFFVFIS